MHQDDAAFRRRRPATPSRDRRKRRMSLTIAAPSSRRRARPRHGAYRSKSARCKLRACRRRSPAVTRASSLTSGTSCAPTGRVDSPPISIIVGTRSFHLERVFDRAVGIEKAAAVGERIRRDVEHAHDRGKPDHAAVPSARSGLERRRSADRCAELRRQSSRLRTERRSRRKASSQTGTIRRGWFWRNQPRHRRFFLGGLGLFLGYFGTGRGRLLAADGAYKPASDVLRGYA